MAAFSPFFYSLATRYSRWKLTKNMDGVWVSGLEAARSAARAGPLVLAPTHVSWWDPLVVLTLDAALAPPDAPPAQRGGRALMDAANLKKLPFFGWAGALPLDRSSPTTARAGLRAAARWLEGEERRLWVFPQGRQRPAHLRPLGLQPGVRVLARDAAVVPVSLTYVFRSSALPAVVARFGEAIPAGQGRLMERLEAALVEGLEAADRWADTPDQPHNFTPLLSPASAPTEDGVGARILQALAGRT